MKGCKKSFAMKCFVFFDAHAVLFTVRIWGASTYETRRVNGIACDGSFDSKVSFFENRRF